MDLQTTVDEAIFSEELAWLRSFWDDAWGKETFQREQRDSDDASVFRYLDLTAHIRAVHSFCDPIREKLYISQEYIEAFNTFDTNTLDTPYEKGACILGQPGIGKTCFIAYAVIERLRQKKPVAVEVSHWDEEARRYLLFTAEGVRIYRGVYKAPLRRCPGIWAFSDSNDKIEIPMSAFIGTFGVRTFQTTSPKESRHKEWTKQKIVSHYIMDLPSEKDIENLGHIMGKNVQIMKDLAIKWGAVPRTVLGHYGDLGMEGWHEEDIRSKINGYVKDTDGILAVLTQLQALDLRGPSPVFFIRPFRVNGIPFRRGHAISIPTQWLEDQVIDMLAFLEEMEIVKFFNAMMGSSKGRTVAGALFESIVHRLLSRGNDIVVHWYKGGKKLGDATTLSFGTLKSWPAAVDLKKTPPPFYWHPDNPNFAGIDGVAVTEHCLYPIQTTIATSHGFNKEGLDKFLLELPTERKKLPKKFLVFGHSEEQTDKVTKALIPELKKIKITHVGAVTIGVNLHSVRRTGAGGT